VNARGEVEAWSRCGVTGERCGTPAECEFRGCRAEAGAVAAGGHDEASCPVCRAWHRAGWDRVLADVDGMRGEDAGGRDRGGDGAATWAVELGRRRFALEFPSGLGGPSEWESPRGLIENLARHCEVRGWGRELSGAGVGADGAECTVGDDGVGAGGAGGEGLVVGGWHVEAELCLNVAYEG
jgi:hypothetical protein